MPGKDLDGGGLGSVIDVPVVDRRVGDEAKSVLANPLPVLDVLVHGRGLELCLGGEIEDLQRPRLRLQGDDLARPVHDGTVGFYGASLHIVAVLQVDDDDLGLGVLLLLYADEGVGLECLWQHALAA